MRRALGGGFCAVCAARVRARRGRVPRAAGSRSPWRSARARRRRWHVDARASRRSPTAPPLDHYLHALKYRGARLARPRIRVAARAARSTHCAHDVDALVAVPLHRTRLRERGYNQAQEIARTLGRVAALAGARARHRAARGDAGPDRAERARAADQRRAGVSRRRATLHGQRIAIVDDVVTTGATVNALAAELRAAGAARCVVFAVARTPEPDRAQVRNV